MSEIWPITLITPFGLVMETDVLIHNILTLLHFTSIFQRIINYFNVCMHESKSLPSCPTLCNPMDYIAHQAPLSIELSKNSGVDCHFLLQRIFLTQGTEPGSLHWRWILYWLSHQRRLYIYCSIHICVCVCVYTLCFVTQMCPTLCNPMDCSLPGPSDRGDSPGKNTGVGYHALLQRIFPTQGSNPGLLHFKQILYWLSQ